MGPAKPRSTTLTEAEEAMVVEFRKRTLLPLDDVLGCLKDSIPKLPCGGFPVLLRRPGSQASSARSALHPCLVRNGISRIPKDPGDSSKRKTFKNTEIGYVHIDSGELRSAEGKLHMFLAIDRVSKFVYVEFYDSPGKVEGSAFLRGVVKAFPYQIRRVLTDNGVAFTKNASTKYEIMQHPFDRVCDENGIEHRLTKPYHPWTNGGASLRLRPAKLVGEAGVGQAERMNRTVKDATTKTFHYDTAEALRAHVLAFVAVYNFAKHLKALKWKTPFQAICNAWTANPSVFKINPHHLIPGPYT